MADTRGFDVVVAARAAVLTKALRGAWKSAECPDLPGDEGRIAETILIDAADGLVIGGYAIESGQIQIPQEELTAALAPAIDGAELTFGLDIQLELQDPPIPSASLLDIKAQVRALVPIRVPDGEKSVFMLLEGLPPGNVTATLPGGDPLASKHNLFVREYIHLLYEQDGTTFPHTATQTDILWNFGIGSVRIDSYSEIYDDLADPAHAITVSGPAGGRIVISIPLYLRIYNVRKSGAATYLALADPMGIETRIIFDAPFETPPGLIAIDIAAATVTVDAITPAGPEHGDEGANYLSSKSSLGSFINLDTLVQNELRQRGEAMGDQIGARQFDVPGTAEIEGVIAQLFHADLATRGRISVWTPGDAPEADFTLRDVASRVHPDFLALALNANGGADINALADFIPADREFAIALSAAQCNAAFANALDESGLNPSDLPKRMEVDGDAVDIRSVNVGLGADSMVISGEVTVIDAIAGSIDVDADFTSRNGLEWHDTASGQAIRDFQIGEPDIDPEESVAAWVIGVILGILTGGLAGGIIAVLILLIVQAIVEGIAQSIGGAIVKDQISDAAVGLGGWPERLARIGFVKTRFENPIGIDPSGIVMAGNLEVVSSCENTAIAFADSGSSYSTSAASALTFSAQRTHADAAYAWLPGDGSAEQAVQDLTHNYPASGIYVARHHLKIEQPGGVRTRHYALVNVANVQPSFVDAGPDITVKEGEVATLVGRFRDVEYPDTHESSWIFGDDQHARAGLVSETNTPPAAVGTSTVSHAWCDNGIYCVTFTVRDQNGGMRQDTLTATVLNVPPEVDAGPDMYAYPCTPITLVANFIDPGWCDTHVATWDFGDCTGARAAIVEQEHLPPAGKGTASAAHVYERCGTYNALCLVTDDDGESGSDQIQVDVVHLQNADFEGGFRKAADGKIANFWNPYRTRSRKAAAFSKGDEPERGRIAAAYDCEECIVRRGQRAQAVTLAPGTRAGIWQHLGANSSWTYEFTAWMHIAGEGTALLGIDPGGGDDPLSNQVLWMERQASDEWISLAVRGTAAGARVTVFAEAEADQTPITLYVDNVEFAAHQNICPEPAPTEAEPPPDAEPERACLNFADLPRNGADTYRSAGFEAHPRAGILQPFALPGIGEAMLLLTPAGVLIHLPFPARQVTARIADAGRKPTVMTGLNASGDKVAEALGALPPPTLQNLTMTGNAIVTAIFTGMRAGLIELCIERDKEPRPEGEKDGGKEMNNPSRSKLDAELRSMLTARGGPGKSAEVDVMIQLDPARGRSERDGPAGEAERFEKEADPVLKRLESLGARASRPLWIGRAIAATLPLEAVEALASEPLVKSIVVDRKRKII